MEKERWEKIASEEVRKLFERRSGSQVVFVTHLQKGSLEECAVDRKTVYSKLVGVSDDVCDVIERVGGRVDGVFHFYIRARLTEEQAIALVQECDKVTEIGAHIEDFTRPRFRMVSHKDGAAARVDQVNKGDIGAVSLSLIQPKTPINGQNGEGLYGKMKVLSLAPAG